VKDPREWPGTTAALFGEAMSLQVCSGFYTDGEVYSGRDVEERPAGAGTAVQTITLSGGT